MVKNPNDNAIIRKALEAVAAIDEEAQKKKREQLAGLNAALEIIRGGVTELLHQEQQLLDAIAKITGKATERKKRASKSDNVQLRERIGKWIEGRGGEKVSAGDLRREFPELEGMPSVGTFLKPLIETGTIRMEGKKGATRYFAK